MEEDKKDKDELDEEDDLDEEDEDLDKDLKEEDLGGEDFKEKTEESPMATESQDNSPKRDEHTYDHSQDKTEESEKHEEHTVEPEKVSEGSSFQDTSRDDSIKIKKEDLWKYAKVVLLAFIILGAFAYFRGPVGVTGDVVGEQPTQLPPAGGKVEVSADDDAFKGDANAPVTIIEFSDYECPFCARFYSQTLAQLESAYIDTGKVKFVYRDFPLSSIHPQAQKAAEAAECAREQGGDEVYFKYHDQLFDNGVQGGVTSFKKFAADMGIDTDQFNDCLDSGKMADEVAKDLADGSSYGVTGTPAFFVNGKLISGAQPFSAFQQVIEAELA